MAFTTICSLPPDLTQAAHSPVPLPTHGAPRESVFSEKRREPRHPTSEPIEVYVLDMQGLRLPGILRDVSRNGLRIELNMPLKAGDRLEAVLQNRAIYFGEVRYCRRADDSYHVGVLIGDVLYPKTIAPEAESRMNARRGVRSKSVWKRTLSPAAGTHVSPEDADGFFRGQLSDTKSALIDRHLASCNRCLDLVLLTLEKKLSTAAPSRGANDICETQLH